MHTILKREKHFEVGIWLPVNDERGSVFQTVLKINSGERAAKIANMLNGGASEVTLAGAEFV